MKIPLIKHLTQRIIDEEFDEDFYKETIEVLISITESRGIKDEELEVIGELISNLEGSLEVIKDVKNGTSLKDSLNNFMKRVLNTIK